MLVKTKRALWLGSAVTVAFAGFATVALAADAEKVKVTDGLNGMQVAQAETPPPPPEAEEEKKVERVVVTGSRLKKNEFTSSAPIQVITREETTLEGLSDTSDILQGSTLSAGSAQTNNAFTGFVANGGPGVNTLSLRGLGANRTLILINGRRIAPAGTRGQTGAADLNTVPESMIDRIEILKDGGSSIYGSDAVAGVVNIITRKSYDGLTLTGFTNQTFEGGGAVYQADALWGETFDRGHIMVNAEYYRREGLAWGDREDTSCVDDRATDSGFNGRFSTLGVGSLLDIIDPATGKSKCFNLLAGNADRLGAGFPGTSGRFIPDPTAVLGGNNGLDLLGWKRVNLTYSQTANWLFPAVVANPAASANAAYDALNATQRAQVEAAWRTSLALSPTDDKRYLSRTVLSPVDRYSAFVEGSYDLLPGVESYTELAFVRRESEQISWRQLFPGVNAANPNNPFGVTSQPVIMLPFNQDQQVDFYRAVLGIKGELGDKMPVFGNWSYDLYLQHSRSEGEYGGNIIINDRVVATTGAAACNGAALGISGDACASVPTGIRWFDPSVLTQGNFSAAERAFLFAYESGHTTYGETTLNGVITGDVWQAPYGMVAGAIGFEARRFELDDTPGFHARNNNLWGLTSAGRTAGEDNVAEAFAEISIPLLAGMKFAEDLTLDGSVRYSSYDSYGDGSTYKLGLNYQITPEYRVRGTTGTSFRAPALFERFLADQTAFANQNTTDPCHLWGTNQSNPVIAQSCADLGLPPNYNAGAHSSILVITGGGDNLTAETSEARTVGFIWTPDWVDLSIALDYWEFEVANEVAQFGAANIVRQCHLVPPVTSPLNPFCSLYTRNLAPGVNFGRLDNIQNGYVNIANQTTDGIDLTVRYENEMSFGKLLINGDFTWTFTDEIRTFLTFPTTDFGGTVIDPDFIANVDVRFDWTDWTFLWNIDMASRASNEGFGVPPQGDLFVFRANSPFIGEYKGYTEWVAVHDVSARYRADDWAITFGVQNLFDDPPPATSATGGGTRTGHAIAIQGPYDLLGRRGFVEVTKEF
jgi:iron complex outermembrane recepter protein